MFKNKVVMGLLLMAAGLPGLGQAESVASAEACTERGGAWERVAAHDWLEACFISAGRTDCAAAGGAWWPEEKRCQLPLAKADILAQCRAKGGAWGRHGAAFDHCFFQSERTKCLAEGGEWLPEGLAGIERCVRHSRDGGKPCSDGSECEFNRCLFGGMGLPDEADLARDHVTGECARTDSPFGCFALIEKGRVGPALCVD
jgi:hypothetical protein